MIAGTGVAAGLGFGVMPMNPPIPVNAPCPAIAAAYQLCVDNGSRFAVQAPENRFGTKKETEGIGLNGL